MKAVVGLYAVLIFVGLTVALPTRAVDSAFADIQRILDAGVVRVAILARDVPPMIMTAPEVARPVPRPIWPGIWPRSWASRLNSCAAPRPTTT